MAFIDHDDIKTELGLSTSDTAKDTIFDVLVEAILSIWDEETGRVWASANYTEYHNAHKSCNKVFLKNYPVASVASLYDDPLWVYGSDTLIDSDDYAVDTDNGIIYYNAEFNEGKRNIKVTYVAGYTDNNVPAWLKQALIRQVCHWFQQGNDKRWDLSSRAAPAGGGTTSYSILKDNFLPDFVRLIEEKRRPN